MRLAGGSVAIFPVTGMPEVTAGADLPEQIARGLEHSGLSLADGDVVVVTQKVVSKAEGRLVDLATVEPSPFARAYAESTEKDAREVELVLRESARVVRMVGRVLISETHHGLICANAGVDRSNVAGEVACLLPRDPDASARAIRAGLKARTGATVAVIISDTFGRPWRVGQTNVAIGVAGMAAMADYRGQLDAHGREMRVSVLAVADELSGAAELVMGKSEAVPVAVIRGYAFPPGEGSARDLLRPAESDLFR